jgi:hypothetical protein
MHFNVSRYSSHSRVWEWWRHILHCETESALNSPLSIWTDQNHHILNKKPSQSTKESIFSIGNIWTAPNGVRNGKKYFFFFWQNLPKKKKKRPTLRSWISQSCQLCQTTNREHKARWKCTWLEPENHRQGRVVFLQFIFEKYSLDFQHQIYTHVKTKVKLAFLCLSSSANSPNSYLTSHQTHKGLKTCQIIDTNT